MCVCMCVCMCGVERGSRCCPPRMVFRWHGCTSNASITAICRISSSKLCVLWEREREERERGEREERERKKRERERERVGWDKKITGSGTSFSIVMHVSSLARVNFIFFSLLKDKKPFFFLSFCGFFSYLLCTLEFAQFLSQRVGGKSFRLSHGNSILVTFPRSKPTLFVRHFCSTRLRILCV